MTNCGRKPIPTILDTDIGNDIDDTWALGMLLNSPEFDLKLVLTSTGDARYRARVAARFLEACGRDDIPVGIGVSRADGSPETMHEYADSYRPEQYSGGFWEDGVGRALELIAAEPELTVIGIAPLTTLAELCRRDERAVSRCRLIVMGGSIAKRHRGAAGMIAEYNIKLDVPAAQRTFRAPWREILLTPLDHCGDIALSGVNYRKIAESTAPYKCKFSPNLGQCTASTKGLSEVDKIKFFYDCGFRGLEDNGMPGRPVEIQNAMAKQMEKLGMEMGVFVAHSSMRIPLPVPKRSPLELTSSPR